MAETKGDEMGMKVNLVGATVVQCQEHMDAMQGFGHITTTVFGALSHLPEHLSAEIVGKGLELAHKITDMMPEGDMGAAILTYALAHAATDMSAELRDAEGLHDEELAAMPDGAFHK